MLQTTVSWKQLLEWKKEDRFDPRQRRQNCLGMRECQRRNACLLRRLLALGRLDAEEGSIAGSSSEAGKNNQTPVVVSLNILKRPSCFKGI